MRHSLIILLVFACFAALFLGCYYPAFFQDRQFGFRDAGHYYYPLYQRVQTEWEAGRWPLWEPEENSGMPLLGNPTAAVLYPGKLIYAVLPYAWGARVYVVVHTVLAFAAMLILMRGWQISWIGSGLGALAYTFGVPVLFQSCNVIYLVGASWLPLGFHAVDRWVRLGRRWGILELAFVLAMQTLGGDPQSSYLLGLAAIGYAAGLAWSRSASGRAATDPGGDSRSGGLSWSWLLLIVVGMVSWVVVTLVAGQWLPKLRPKGFPPPALPWMRYVPQVMAGVWLAAGLGFLLHWRRRGWRNPLGNAWLGLAGAAALACALAGAQLLPVFEFTQQTSRAAVAGTHDIYPFSIEPFRLTGLLWPNLFGIQFEGNTFWGDLLRLPGASQKVWVPSFYMGCLALVMAMGTISLRRGAPWRIWLSAIMLVSLVLSLGEYTSPIWATRVLAAVTKQPALEELVRELGPLDKDDATPIRLDRYLRDGDGSVYWWISAILPGFRQFRFPAKFFTFVSLSLAVLAGMGWDELRAGGMRRVTAIAALFLAMSLAGLGGVLFAGQRILYALRSYPVTSPYGPFDPEGAYAAIVRSLLQTSIVLGLGLVAVRLVRTRPLLAGAIVLIVATGDLAAANVRFVLTVPQSFFETVPEVARLIQDAERERPANGPYRVHRMPMWDPMEWLENRSVDRNLDLVSWERDTLQPKYGINYGIEYAHTMGVAEIYDYEWYFGGFLRKVRTAEMARALNVEVGKEVVYFPRRTFNMWNVRYFIVPMFPNGWRDEFRGYAAFLLSTERVYPEPGKFLGPENKKAFEDWVKHQDFQIMRNLDPHPRAWIVHEARTIAAVEGLSPEKRQQAMQEITYSDDPFWHNADLHAFDPLAIAWIEQSEAPALNPYLPGGLPKRSETVRVTYPDPQHVEIEVNLEKPGVVVLADVYYPGWELTIDDKPATIYQVNRLMRGAAVPKGKSRLVYTYNPRAFRVGRIVSMAGFGILALLALAFTLRPLDPIIGPSSQSISEESPSDATA